MSSRDEHDTKQRELLAEEPARDGQRSTTDGSGSTEAPSTGRPSGADGSSSPTGGMGRPAWLREQSSPPRWLPQPPPASAESASPSAPAAPDRQAPETPATAQGATKLPTLDPGRPALAQTPQSTGDSSEPVELFPGLKRFLEGIGSPQAIGESDDDEETPAPARPAAAVREPSPLREAPSLRQPENREPQEPRQPRLPVPETTPRSTMPVPETQPVPKFPVPETMPTGGMGPKAPENKGGLFSSAKELFGPKESRPPRPSRQDEGDEGSPASRTLAFGGNVRPGSESSLDAPPTADAPRNPGGLFGAARKTEGLFGSRPQPDSDPRSAPAPRTESPFGSRQQEDPRPPRPKREAWQEQARDSAPTPFPGGQPRVDSDAFPPHMPMQPERRPTAESLTADVVLRKRGNRPGRGWRKSLYKATLGYINLGPSQQELQERQQNQRIRTALTGSHRLAIISLKGGVGKTTTTAGLGATFASIRGDRVIAIDANPDRGTLGEKVPRQTPRTVRDMLNARNDIHRYSDVRAYTSQATSRLEVLASDTDPAMSLAFSEEDYRQAVDILSNFYSLILTDCGTGLLHDAMRGVLAMADSLVVISSASLDGARSASATLDWLEAHGYEELVRRSVAVISAVHGGGTPVDIDKLEEHFQARCRAVVRVPWDPHLEEGSIVDLDELRRPTRDAYRELAALVADDFPTSRQWRPQGQFAPRS